MSQGLMNVSLYRDGPGTAWGFRLQGGRDIGQPLSVQRIFLGSPSEGELRTGDVLLRIGTKDAGKLTHQEAHNYIKSHGNNLNLVIHRGPYSPAADMNFVKPYTPTAHVNPSVNSLPKTQFSPSGKPQQFRPYPPSNLPVTQFQDEVSDVERERVAITNQPHRTFPLIQPGVKVRHDLPTGSYLRHVNDPFVRAPPPSAMKGHGLVNQANEYLMKAKIQETVTNAASNNSSIGSPVRGRSETPESGSLPQGILHRQYNSPIHLYSPQNVAATITGQTGIPVTPAPSGPVRIVDISQSPTFRTIYEEEWKELRKDQLREHKPVQNQVKTIPPSDARNFNPFGTPKDRIQQSKTFDMINDCLIGESSY